MLTASSMLVLINFESRKISTAVHVVSAQRKATGVVRVYRHQVTGVGVSGVVREWGEGYWTDCATYIPKISGISSSL